MVRRVDRNEEGGCNLVQKVFGFCAASIDITVRSLAENARDEGGYSRWVLLDTLEINGADH